MCCCLSGTSIWGFENQEDKVGVEGEGLRCWVPIFIIEREREGGESKGED